MPSQPIDVIIPDGMAQQPEAHEIEIAWILVRHYKCIVEFLQPIAAYKVKTPDIVMKGISWEIKSPTGSSKKATIESQFKGLKQSRNLVIDGRRTKLDDMFAQKQIDLEKSKHSRIGRILYITKTGKIIEF